MDGQTALQSNNSLTIGRATQVLESLCRTPSGERMQSNSIQPEFWSINTNMYGYAVETIVDFL